MKELTKGWEERTPERKIKMEKERVKEGLGIGRGIIKKRTNEMENKTEKIAEAKKCQRQKRLEEYVSFTKKSS